MPYANVNGVSLYYDEFGSGDKVVITASGGDFKHPDNGKRIKESIKDLGCLVTAYRKGEISERI